MWHIANRGIMRNLRPSKAAHRDACAERSEELDQNHDRHIRKKRRGRAEQIKEINLAFLLATDFRQPAQELSLQLEQIHRKWNDFYDQELALSEQLINHKWDKHCDDLEANDLDNMQQWVEVLLPLMPEGALFLPMPDRGTRDRFGVRHGMMQTRDEQCSQALRYTMGPSPPVHHCLKPIRPALAPLTDVSHTTAACCDRTQYITDPIPELALHIQWARIAGA
jgi:hypothetical protein